ERFMANASAMFVSGDGRGAFEVLVPIGYLLIMASVGLLGCRVHRHCLIGLWVLSVGAVYALRWNGLGNSILELVTMGILGMVIGRASLVTIDRAVRPVAGWVALYGIYVVLLSVSNVTYGMQVVGLVIIMALLYILARRLIRMGVIGKWIGV